MAVKRKYGMAVNPSERDALANMLAADASREVTCGTTPVAALPFLDSWLDRLRP